MTDSIPPFENTALDTIPPMVNGIRAAFNTQVTKSIDFRLVQLRKLFWAISDYEKEIEEALKRDLGKSSFEAYLSEIDFLKADLLNICKRLSKWMKDESVEDIPITLSLMSPRIRKEPLGAALVIGAYNYPFQLALGPFAGAISAGCTVVLKPSEQAPNVAMVMEKIISRLDPSCYACIQGGIPETTTLLDQKWDKIFYTGGANVGRIIAKKAAENLTPVTLELGGKIPAIVSKNANIPVAARRLLWGKAINAGQTCLSQNYHLVERSILPALTREMGIALKEFYPSGPANSPDYGRIATARGWHRLKSLLDSTNGKILMGGKMDEASKFLDLTVVEVTDPSDPLVQEEHFGPIIVLLAVDDLDSAIRIANDVDPTPLALYPFGTKAEAEKILGRVRSGGASINDTIFHGGNPMMPFGGVGESGQGAWHGRASFDSFSHRRVVMNMPSWLERVLKNRYPPYTAAKLKQLQGMNNLKPNFDREGRLNWGLWEILFSRRGTLAALVLGKSDSQKPRSAAVGKNVGA